MTDVLYSENRVRYLEMIQANISRMAANSFSLKSWAVTLVAGILALSSDESNKVFFLIAFIPVVVFWFLDAYYLQLERKYRGLFEVIRIEHSQAVDFNLNPNNSEIELSGKVKRSVRYISCFFSKSEWLFYVPIGLIIVIVMNLEEIVKFFAALLS